MSPHADILDRPESLRTGLLRSVVFHGLFFGSLAFYSWWTSRGETFGDPNASGGAVGVEAVNKIPLASQGRRNPVANDTASEVPAPPPKPVEKAQEPEPRDERETFSIKSRLHPKPPKPQTVQKKFTEEVKPNQLTSAEGQRMSSMLFSPAPGAGGVGVGPATSLGTRFGEYEARMRQIIASKWQTGDLDRNLKTAPVVIVTFEILRDGTIRGVKLAQSSGVFALDTSTQRAVLDASPLPPLPNGFERDSARVEILFQLKR